MLYRFVDDQKAAGFPVERICEVAGVSRAAYYDWKAHRDGIPTIGELEEARLVKEIGDIHDDCRSSSPSSAAVTGWSSRWAAPGCVGTTRACQVFCVGCRVHVVGSRRPG